MAQINHNISSPNDDLGDQLRTAFGNQNTMNTELYDTKVDEVAGKGLSTNDFTNTLKAKLDALNAGAGINIQADWEQEDDTADDYIKNKPTEYFNSVGSFHYADLTTQTTPLSGVANVEKNLTNDIDGAETDLTNAPYGISTLWDSAGSELDFSQLAIGDVVNLRTTLKVTTSTANQNIHVYARIGIGSSSEKDLLIGSKFVETAGEITFDEELTIVISKEDYINYIGELFLLSENNSTIKVQEFEFVVIRKNINVIDIDGLTDLSATRTPTNVQINSSTGTSALIGLADATNAGLLKPAKYTVLENTSGTNTGDQDLSGKANIASPTFTGTPLAPTATLGTNTTQVATTAFVLENSSSSNYWTKTGDDIANNNTGFVGIGTSTPRTKLEITPVAGVNFQFTNSSPNRGVIQLINNSTSSIPLDINASEYDVKVQTASTIFIDSSKIKLKKPTDIIGASSTEYIALNLSNSSSTANQLVTLDFTNASVTTARIKSKIYLGGLGGDFQVFVRNITNTAYLQGLLIEATGLATLPSVTNALIEADTTGKALVTKEYVNRTFTVATLPSVASGVAHATVTDATAPTYLGTLTGGGAVTCPVFYNGTTWVSH